MTHNYKIGQKINKKSKIKFIRQNANYNIYKQLLRFCNILKANHIKCTIAQQAQTRCRKY